MTIIVVCSSDKKMYARGKVGKNTGRKRKYALYLTPEGKRRGGWVSLLARVASPSSLFTACTRFSPSVLAFAD